MYLFKTILFFKEKKCKNYPFSSVENIFLTKLSNQLKHLAIINSSRTQYFLQRNYFAHIRTALVVRQYFTSLYVLHKSMKPFVIFRLHKF